MPIRMEQGQKQVLSHKMIQSVEILQMNSQELKEYMEKLAMENPVVDLEEASPAEEKEDSLKKIEWLSASDECNRTYHSYDYSDSENDWMSNIGKEEAETLESVLMLQLIGGAWSKKDLAIFKYIAECLDENGYYTAPLPELAVRFGLTEEEACRYLDIMKGLEPAGICAGSLKECLLIQLEREAVPNDFDIRVVQNHLDLLGKNQLPVIAREMNQPVGRILKTLRHIQKLDPRPGQPYAGSKTTRYIVPDITVTRTPNGFEVTVNRQRIPSLRVNRDYLAMMKSDCPKDAKDYLAEKIGQINHVKQCVAKRSTTLSELTRYIIDVQYDFFLHGESGIRPLMMREAAKHLAVHESTISRAVRDKYLQCCWGIYPMSFFFSKGVASASPQGTIPTLLIKKALTGLIENEDKKKPLSDQKIAEKLKDQGMAISRRTVTKYREAESIPNYRERKSFD